MTQFSNLVSPTSGFKTKSGRKLTKRRSSSLHEIKNTSVWFDIKITIKKIERSNWLHSFLDEESKDDEYFCDECKYSSPNAECKSIDAKSLSSWRSENKNRNRRSARPLKKLNAMDE